jgi:hypothetical protein
MEEATARIASKLQVQYEECPTVSGSVGGPRVRIQIRRIRMLLGASRIRILVRGTDPAPNPSLFS